MKCSQPLYLMKRKKEFWKKSCLVLNLLVFIENTKVLKGIFFVFLFLSNKQYYFCNLKFFLLCFNGVKINYLLFSCVQFVKIYQAGIYRFDGGTK